MNEWMFIHYQYISIPICVLGVELETQWQRMAAWHSTPLYATDPHIEVSSKAVKKPLGNLACGFNDGQLSHTKCQWRLSETSSKKKTFPIFLNEPQMLKARVHSKLNQI